MPINSISEVHQTLAINLCPERVGRQEYINHMTFKSNVRPLFTETFGPLIGLKEEWQVQGASPEELDFSCFRFRDARMGVIPVNTGWFGTSQETILEETDSYILAKDQMGRTMKLCKGYATLPLPLDYPVTNMDDWLRLKQNYSFSYDRFALGWKDTIKQFLAEDKVIVLQVPGGFDEVRQLMGEENTCLGYYEQPELVKDILATISDMVLQIAAIITDEFPIDQVSIHEDMAGKSGPLAGPRQIVEFIGPYYRTIKDSLYLHGCKSFLMDSDGNMDQVLKDCIENGINLMGPMEPAAGMDMVVSRYRYGSNLAYWGGIDKMVLLKTRADIVKELEYKLPPIIKTGGCVLGLDHRIPNGTMLDDYRFYLKTAWEIIDSFSS